MGFRQRYGYAVITMLLLAAAAAATAPQPPTTGDITGTYFCEGTNSDGSPYHGVVTISRRADAYYFWWKLQPAITAFGVGLREGNTLGVSYYLLWELQPAVTAFGVGLREGNTLGVSYYGPNTGIIVYRIEGNRLIGRWTVPGADDVAAETLTPFDQAPIRPPNQSPGAPGDTGSGLPIRL